MIDEKFKEERPFTVVKGEFLRMSSTKEKYKCGSEMAMLWLLMPDILVHYISAYKLFKIIIEIIFGRISCWLPIYVLFKLQVIVKK